MPDATRSTRYHSVSLFRGMTISAFIGMIISMLFSAGDDDVSPFRPPFIGAIIGVFIYLSVASLEQLFDPLLSRLSDRRRPLALGPLYVIGGMIGWTLGVMASLAILRGEWVGPGLTARESLREVLLNPALRKTMLISAVIAAIIGLLFYAFDRLEMRLQESIERLKQHEFAEKELGLARAIQQRLLPAPELEQQGVRISARNLPAHFVAGDFYDIFARPDGSLVVAVGDVSGKGIGASLIMATVKTVLPLLAVSNSAAEVLNTLNAKLCRDLGRREFVALTIGIYEPREGRLTLANAGLPDPYRIPIHGAPQPIEATGPRLPLGVRTDIRYEEMAIGLRPGERVLCFTDGLPEARTTSDEPLGYEALEQIAADRSLGSLPTSVWLDDFLGRVRAATREEIEDDWTALLLERVL